MPNRLNLAIQQNLAAFADDLHLSPEQASQWHKFVGLLDSLKPTKVHGVKLKLEEEVVLVMAALELPYNLQGLVKDSRSGLLKTASMLTPSFQSAKLLMGWTMIFNNQGDPFLRSLDPEQKITAWEIVFGTLTSLAKMSLQDLVAVCNLSEDAITSLPHKDVFEFGSLPTAAFIKGLQHPEPLTASAQGTTLFKHQKRLLNHPLKSSFRLAAVR